MIELGAGGELAVQRSWRATDRAAVADRDLARADARGDLQPGERDRDRVAVLADRDQRLLIDPRRRGLGRVKRLRRQREQQRPLDRPRLADRRRRARSIRRARSGSQPASSTRVELGEVRDARDRDEVVAAEAADLALDAALLVRALKARRA